jgi:hypothetical protein
MDQHVPVDISAVVDTITAQPDSTMYSSYDLGDVETFAQLTGTDASSPWLTVNVAGPASGLDPARIPRDRPVPIAGTTGYYSNFKMFPIDGSTGPGSDKWLPAWTIAFPHGSDWVFAWLETAVDTATWTNSVDDPERIARLYQQYDVNLDQPVARLPFRTGWLPDGLTLSTISFQRAAQTNAIQANGASISFAAPGDRYLTIDLAHAAPTQWPVCQVPDTAASMPAQAYSLDGSLPTWPPGSDCTAQPGRDLGDGFTLQGTGSGLDDATVQRVLDSITIAEDLNDPGTFFTLADALG